MSLKEHNKDNAFEQLPQIFSGKLRSLYKVDSTSNQTHVKRGNPIRHQRSLSADFAVVCASLKKDSILAVEHKLSMNKTTAKVKQTDNGLRLPPSGSRKSASPKERREDKVTHLDVHYPPHKKSPGNSSSNISGSRENSPAASSPASPSNMRQRISELSLCPHASRRNSMDSKPSRSSCEDRGRKFCSAPNSPNTSPKALRKKRTSVPNVLLHKRIVEYPTPDGHADLCRTVQERKLKEILHEGAKCRANRKPVVPEGMSSETFDRCRKWLSDIEHARHNRGFQEIVQPVIHWQEND